VPYDDLAYTVVGQAVNGAADMIILPWLPPHPSADAYGAPTIEPVTPSARPTTASIANPFDLLFKSGGGGGHSEKSASVLHSQFVRGVFSRAKTDVALFIDQIGPIPSPVKLGSSRHIFLPFFGGPDDRLALAFVVQLCSSEHVTATVVRFVKRDAGPAVINPPQAHLSDKQPEEANLATVASATATFPDTVYGQPTTATRLQSETADNISWTRYTSPSNNDPADFAPTGIDFKEVHSPVPLHSAIKEAESCAVDMKGHPRELLVLAGRSRRLAVENHVHELKGLMEEHGSVVPEVKRTIGDVATAFVVVGCGSGVVVVQAAMLSDE